MLKSYTQCMYEMRKSNVRERYIQKENPSCEDARESRHRCHCRTKVLRGYWYVGRDYITYIHVKRTGTAGTMYGKYRSRSYPLGISVLFSRFLSRISIRIQRAPDATDNPIQQ